MQNLKYSILWLLYIVVMAFAFSAFDFWTIHFGWAGYNWFGDYRFFFNDVVSWLCPLGYGLAENVFYLWAQWFHGWTGNWWNPVGDWTYDWGGSNFYPMWKWYLSFGARQVVWTLLVYAWLKRRAQGVKQHGPRRIERAV